jgi:hypothetical protein
VAPLVIPCGKGFVAIQRALIAAEFRAGSACPGGGHVRVCGCSYEQSRARPTGTVGARQTAPCFGQMVEAFVSPSRASGFAGCTPHTGTLPSRKANR